MKRSLLSVLRKNTKLLNTIVVFTCWSQIHAYANSYYLNKQENIVPIMKIDYALRSGTNRKISKNVVARENENSKISNAGFDIKNKNLSNRNIIPVSKTIGYNAPANLLYAEKRYYISDIKEGIIGTDAEHPIDQIYDNIFTISVDEKINPTYQYTLEYDLYGVDSYKAVSKVINDELAVGGNNVKKNADWVHQSEPIAVQLIKQGKNTVIFTLPYLADYSYKVRNLKIEISNKKQNFENTVGAKYDALSTSKFVPNIGNAEKLSLSSAELNIPKGTLKSAGNFSITALRDIDMPALTPEMVNVTSENAGYRFLPHGDHFSSPAKISLGYDKSKIPAGYTVQDIKTFYFDRKEKKWFALDKDSVNVQQNILVSKTTHFTDMVNGVLKVPESPDTGSYAPNSIKDIKAANPSEGIVSIAPPSPNSMGSVTTNFPIKLPVGRAGMQPSLNVSYSSEGGNGWMGLGWDMSVPSIGIDTRWGVPRYDADKETEIYSMGGEQLTFEVSPGVYAMPNRNEGFDKGRQSDRQFYPRIEGAYNRIIRKGTDPTNYVWIVTSKDGTKSYFGGDDSGIIDNAILKDASGNIGYWGLYKTVDTNGNYVKYEYDKTVYSTSGALGNGGKEMYPSKIEYTLNDADPSLKKYAINFTYDTAQRDDIQVNARFGFVQVTSKRLGGVQILYNGVKVRSYEFKYKTGAFSKSLLETVTEKDADDQIFYSNKIEYFNNIETSQYAPETAIDGVANDAGINSSSLLGHGDSKNTTAGGALTFGVALAGDKSGYNPLIKSATIGGDYQFTQGEGGGRLSITDIDGDGLPDKILKNDWSSPDTTFKYRKKGQDTNPFGSSLLNPENSKAFSYSKSYTNAIGIQATAGDLVTASLSGGTSKTKDFTYNYFTDANSDGIQDIANNGQIYFGRLDNGVLKYTTDVSLTPNPIVKGAAVSTPSIDCNDILEDYKNSPLHDVVKAWKAPFDGTVSLNGILKLKNPASSPDGVKISIQQYNSQPNTFAMLGSSIVLNAASNSYTLSQPTVPVKQGDYIYFRVNSRDNGVGDLVELPINISYTYIDLYNPFPAGTHWYYDSSDTSLGEYKNVSLVSSKSGTGIPVNVSSGTIAGTFVKPVTVTDIKVNVLKKQANGTTISIGSQQYTASSTGNLPVLLNTGAMNEGDIIYFQVRSDVNEKWENLKFSNLKLTMNYNGSEIEQAVVPDFQFFNLKTNTASTFRGAYFWGNYGTPFAIYAKLTGKPAGKYTYVVRKSVRQQGAFFDKTITTINWTGSVNSIQDLSIYQSMGSYMDYYVECYSDLASDEGLDGPIPDMQVEIRDSSASNLSAPNIFATFGINVYGRDKDNVYKDGSTTDLSKDDARFGTMYRNWGQFVYHGGYGTLPASCSQLQNQLTDYGSQPIDQSKLVPPNDPNDSTPLNQRQFIMMNAYNGKDFNTQTNPDYVQRLIGVSQSTYTEGQDVSASRMGMADMGILSQSTPANSPGIFNAPVKQSKTTNTNTGASAGPGVFSLNHTTSTGDTFNTLDYFDMNGDGYPDVLNGNTVQFTNMIGMLSGSTLPGSNDNSHKTHHKNTGFGMGQNYPLSGKSNKSSSQNALQAAEAGINFSAGTSDGTDFSEYSYIDINGDGLLDRVAANGQVQLNLGYSYAPSESLSYGNFREGETTSSNLGIGASIGGTITDNLPKGLSMFNASISLGAGKSETITDQKISLVDINNDGLADLVSSSGGNLSVQLNTGNKFVSIPWNASSAIQKDVSRGYNMNMGITASVLIPIGTTGNSFKISINPSTSFGEGDSNVQQQLLDLNGDGYPDLVKSQTDGSGNFINNTALVKYSTIGTTNLLRKVTAPMGGSWEIDYERVGNTYDMPQSKYVLKSVITNDGFTGDNAYSPDTSKITVEYQNPYYSRRERTFYGFSQVKINQIDTKQGGIASNVVYRKTIQDFNNQSYYLKGALLNEKVLDANDILWTEKRNTYLFRKISNTSILQPLLLGESEKSAANYAGFVALSLTNSMFYEGKDSDPSTPAIQDPGKTTSTRIDQYDQWGNATTVTDYGDNEIGASEALQSTVVYTLVNPSAYIVMPTSVKNTANGVTREKKAAYNTNGDLSKMTIVNQGVDYSVYDFEYDIYGNITKSTGPANVQNQRFFHQYTYDDNVKTYPVKVQDAFGYSSKTQYDFRFGVPTYTEDMNLQPMRYVYDAKARTTEITGPYELFNNIPWTIKFEYNPITDAPLSAANAQSFAVTKHYDPEYTDSTINTITIADGFGGAIQVKKTGDIHNEGVKYIVAGKVEEDAFGRSLKTYYPTVESVSSNNTQYNAAVDNIEPTVNQYDVLDRVVYTKLPGENLFSTITYGFGTDVQGRKMFETIFKDELGSVKKTYTDIKGRTTSVHEVSNTGDIKTQFTHDAIGEILQVKDVNGNITTSVYDDLGRRISYTHPDSGVTTYKYDPANNLIFKTNAANETVEYKYDYSRLKEVKYPLYPENNVKYYYGNALDASAMDNNAVGRLWYQTDATGTQYLKYGRLGELTYQRRSVAVPGAQVYWFGTEWQYDTWNRVKTIKYPDGEKLTYKYNRAGNLNNVASVKDGNSYPMINNIGYDKFEQRVYLKNGNNTETTYEYETNRRRLLKMYAQNTNTNRFFMQNVYQYDVVSNVMQIHNNAPVVNGLLGGGTNYAFGYDDLYRLTSASGNWRGINDQAQEERHRYTVAMSYDNMHNIMSKTQKHEWAAGASSNSWTAMEPTSYRLNYKYENAAHPHAPTTIIDEPNLVPSSTCCNPDDPGVKFQHYKYDAKGNPTTIDQESCTYTESKTVYQWDEENRLRYVDTNPSTPEVDGAAIYTYDAGGERIIKDVLYSGAVMRTTGEVQPLPPPLVSHAATIYPNGLLTMNVSFDGSGTVSKPRYTKHYYAGSQRIVSKNGTSNNIGVFDCSWLIIPFGGSIPQINPVNVSNATLQASTQSSLAVMQQNNIAPPPNYGQNAGYTGGCANDYSGDKEKEIYWFHPDHLGSSSYISGADGEVTQNIEYLPSGEVFVENHKNSNYSPYKFNSKELDAETGYYYYGARYYNPRISLWLNVDPLADYNPFYNDEHYIDGEHNGGVFNSGNGNPYIYCYQNPVIFIDPNGRQGYFMTPGNISSPQDVQIAKRFLTGVGNAVKDGYESLKWQFNTSYKMNFGSPSEMIATANEMNSNAQITGKYLASGNAFDDTSEALKTPEGLGYVTGTVGIIYATKKIGGKLGSIVKLCFVSGTLISTSKGLEKIENIKEGDLVWTYNELTSTKEIKKVLALSENISTQIIIIDVGDQKIEATPEHPFYVDGKWVQAKDLTINDKLYSKNGVLLTITSISKQNRNEKVYNFEVEENHNYFVSNKEILVHNDCGTGWIAKSLYSKLNEAERKVFETALKAGSVTRAEGVQGIKYLKNGKKIGNTTYYYELKTVPKSKLGDYRLYGNYKTVQVGKKEIKTVIFEVLKTSH
ncbi:SpvB/TcaC N-terminal domain-containing protein [uncultured Chryseobacterium sp.]|uniref:SpvB/TcaC N-terminal domain-containing protein n=1 Tax=uncultured Chryseobacterium sp. TaxID=259322 RepID=UPI00258D8970|nr:SpvB/TcaC N-terminal domain-containing protein [uncultured Chryseobacterium sp.]